MSRTRRIVSVFTLALMVWAAVWCCCQPPGVSAAGAPVAVASSGPHSCCQHAAATTTTAPPQGQEAPAPECPDDHDRSGGGCPILAVRLNSVPPDAQVKPASPFSILSFATPAADLLGLTTAQLELPPAVDASRFDHPPASETLLDLHSLLLC